MNATPSAIAAELLAYAQAHACADMAALLEICEDPLEKEKFSACYDFEGAIYFMVFNVIAAGPQNGHRRSGILSLYGPHNTTPSERAARAVLPTFFPRGCTEVSPTFSFYRKRVYGGTLEAP